MLSGPIVFIMLIDKVIRHIVSHPFEVFSVRERLGIPPLSGSSWSGLYVRLAVDMPSIL